MMKNFSYSRITHPNNFKFKIARAKLHNTTFDIHTHDFSELVIVLGGTAIHMTDHGNYPLVAGDVFVLNGDMAHGYDQCVSLDICNIMYDPEQLLVTQADIRHLAGYQALFVVEPLYRANHPMHNLLRLSMAQLGQVREMLDKMINEQKQQAEGFASMIHAYFIQLVVRLSRIHNSQIDTRSQSIGRLANALTLLETQYHQPLSLDHLAQSAHLSPTHFSRLFKETFKLAPIQYLIRLRIAKACHLLSDPALSIADVAEQTGFTDSNYFSRQFKQIMGQSPQRYRKIRER